jgi:DNA polymerase elongation subunit (family B)
VIYISTNKSTKRIVILIILCKDCAKEMYQGNKEYFIFRRKLIDDAKRLMVNVLPLESKKYENDEDGADVDVNADRDVTIDNYYQRKRKQNSLVSNIDNLIEKHNTGNKSQQINPQNRKKYGLVYVVEWYDDDTSIIGYGCNTDGIACRLQPKINPGLFVASGNCKVLQEYCKLHGYKMIQFNITYRSNNFSLHDLFQRPDMNKPCHLVKIETSSVTQANMLYNELKRNEMSYKYACVPHYWDVTKQILFELIVKQNTQRLKKRLTRLQKKHESLLGKAKNYEERQRLIIEFQRNKQLIHENCSVKYCGPKTSGVWFDDDLNSFNDIVKPSIPIITFDIETVSSDPHRVPDGSHPDDILFTVSIHHMHTNILYTLIYLPLKDKSCEEYKDLIKSKDGYMILPDKRASSSTTTTTTENNNNFTNCTNVLEVYHTEIDLLKRSMNLLQLNGLLHYLVGYNSSGYDIKYLLMRCCFYNIKECVERFVWREGYCYGMDQIHIDLFRITMIRYRFPSYTLDSVAKNILQEAKTGVSAVNLRYTFYRMIKYKRYFLHEECSEKTPSIRDTLHYNNMDTLLVSQLIVKTFMLDFIFEFTNQSRIPISYINTNYNKMRFKVWNYAFSAGLDLGLYLGTFKSPIISLAHHIPSTYPNNSITLRYDMTNQLNHNSNNIEQPTFRGGGYNNSNNTARGKFPGGANFCLGEIDVKNVQMYDYVTAYSILIDRANISDETVLVLPANALLASYDYIVKPEEYHTWDYMTHNGATKSETNILYYQYIYNNLYCGKQFDFTRENLQQRSNSPVIVIWQGRRGILSDIVRHFNDIRSVAKTIKKTLDEAVEIIGEAINTIEEYQDEMQELKEQQQQQKENETNNVSSTIENNTDYDEDLDDDFLNACGDSNNDVVAAADDEDDDDDFVNLVSTTNEEMEINNENNNNEDDDDDDDDFVNLVSTINNDTNEEMEINNENNNDEDDDDDFMAACGGGDVNMETILETENTTNKDDVVAVASCNINNDGGNDYDDDNEEEEDEDNDDDKVDVYESLNCDIFSIYKNNTCKVNIDVAIKMENPIAALLKLQADVQTKGTIVENQYLLLKSLISSFYGCQDPRIAATITCQIRQFLLSSSQYLQNEGHEIYYVDTDSIMITNKDGINVDLSPVLNTMFPLTKMEMKVAPRCMFVKKKTYYKLENGALKYGQNVNGPLAWRECVQFFYGQTHITTNDDIYNAFFTFFEQIYSKLLSFNDVTPEFFACITQMIKVKQEYKTNSVAKRFKDYMQQNYPELAGNMKHSVFYYIGDDVTAPTLRPAIDLKSVDGLRYVNLFKYYQNMYTTLFNIIKFHIRKNNEPINLTISMYYVILIMMKSYLDVYCKVFPNPVYDSPTPNKKQKTDNETDDDLNVISQDTIVKKKYQNLMYEIEDCNDEDDNNVK